MARRRWACFATSPSMPGRMRSRNSTTVTSAPSRRQTEPSSRPMTPAPTTSSRFGTAGERQRAGRGDDALLVDLDARERRRVRAGGDDDRLCLDVSVAPSSLVTRTLPGPAIAPVPRNAVDLVLLEQERDAGDVGLDHRVLVGHASPSRSSFGLADLDAEAGEIVAGRLEQLGGVEQRLRRDAADIEAGAAEGRVLLDDGDLEAELGGADGADIAAGAAADDGEIVGHEDCLARRMGRDLPSAATKAIGMQPRPSAHSIQRRSSSRRSASKYKLLQNRRPAMH